LSIRRNYHTLIKHEELRHDRVPGVLRAAELADVPAVEVRAIANEIEEPDRAAWRFEEAFDAIATATPRLLKEIELCVR
jgi:hypothetical protein